MTPRIADGSKRRNDFQPMALRPQHRHHDGAERDQLEHALGEVRHRLLAEHALEAGAGRHLAEFRLEGFARPHQPVLDHVARDRSQHQHQQRHADGRQHGNAQRVAELQQRGAVGPQHACIGDEVAQRHQDAAADRTREGRQHERGARDHEPGVDLLALGNVAARMRVVETFLCRVFCLVVAVVGHRGALACCLSMLYLSGVRSCMTPVK